MKQKIVSNTILFLGIILFVKLFELGFGKENSLVGVSTIIAALVLLSKDLTDNKLAYFLKLVCINLIIGIGSFIAAKNIYFGLIINFLIIGFIGYYFSYNFTKNLIVAFGLEYIFLLYNPVSGIIFRNRILGLIFGAIFIMITQLIIYGKKNKKEIPKSDILEFKEENKNDKKLVKLFGKEFEVHPLRARYAIRVGILVSLTAFISGYFGLAQGRWMSLTVFSLTELYSENCKIRSKQRLQGTIIGAIIVILLFMMIKNPAIRTIIVLIGGYLDTYTNNYRDKIVCVTISVVAAMGLSSGSIQSSVERIGYVFIGVIISLIANKFIFSNSEIEIEQA